MDLTSPSSRPDLGSRAGNAEPNVRGFRISFGILVAGVLCCLLVRLFQPNASLVVALLAAISFSVVTSLGRQSLPGLAAGAILLVLSLNLALLASTLLFVGCLAGAIIGGSIIRRSDQKTLQLDCTTDVGLLVISALLASIPVALAASTALVSAEITVREYAQVFITWWLMGVLGILVIAPLILTSRDRQSDGPTTKKSSLTWIGMSICLLLATGFGLTDGMPRFLAMTASLPLVAIAATRYGPRGAAFSNLFSTALVFTLPQIADGTDFLFAAIAFLIVMTMTALWLGAVTAERDTALERLAADIAMRIAAEANRKAAENEKLLAETALAADRARFEALLEHSYDTFAVMTPDGETAFVSDAITRLTGRSQSMLLGRSVFEHVHPDDVPLVRMAFTDCLAHPNLPIKAEFRISTTDGAWVWLEAVGVNHRDNPAVGGLVVNIRDISERRDAEAKLSKTRELLEVTGHLARIGGWEYVIRENRLIWSDQTFRIHELSEIAGTPTIDSAIEFYAPEARPLMRAAVDRGLQLGEGWNLVLPFVTARGRHIWVNAIGQVELRAGRPHRLYGTFQDVTQRVEAELAIARSEARYKSLFEFAPVAIWEDDLSAIDKWFAELRSSGVSDLAGHLVRNPALIDEAIRMIKVRDVNQAAVFMNRAANKADLINNMHRLFTSQTRVTFVSELDALWRGERNLRLETKAQRLSGEQADVVLHIQLSEVGGQPDFSRVVILAIDVTEQKSLENEHRQSQKLNAVGRLAGGIAHDFNNLLTVINGFAEIIVADSPPGARVRDLAGHIKDAGGRAAALTRQLLAFSRKQPASTELVDLSALVTALQPLLATLTGDTIQLKTNLDSVLPILADRTQIESVILNLAVNGRDAMPRGGTLTIETRNSFEPTQAPSEPSLNRLVVLTVSDTGTGISEEIQPHLFEPFFTTKELGKGTGLGLSTVYGVVTTAGGQIRYETASGVGTTFYVSFPAAKLSSESVSAGLHRQLSPVKGPSLDENTATRGERLQSPVFILLVEDQPEIRTLASRILKDARFQVTEAENGVVALEKLKTIPRGSLVLVTDVMMPRMNGCELAEKVRALRPGVPVLYVSGYAPETILPSTIRPDEAFLSKPFSPLQMIQAVRSILTHVRPECSD